ncbi:hypothetical protein BLEM_1393 [Bifidobacterium lemurum]|uniref:Uncharacterized protein n=1 Tax=Bifidobacterium lemurum TaxID=1603886 RepID=A0A261FR34_9BIFI|nr:hypothetical protein [Bifidobacterium lemurum]OZG61445.1 hypothetical protein BLEM_1393 [Bifidobacterium lemurum]QOL35127.1 hypothetical protein BL8807_04500 [Bifidobacterium lemurum]
MADDFETFIDRLVAVLEANGLAEPGRTVRFAALGAGEDEAALEAAAMCLIRNGIILPDDLMTEFGYEVEFWDDDALSELYDDMKAMARASEPPASNDL